MPPSSKLPFSVQVLLCCPVCKAKLESLNDQLKCTNPACSSCFPIVDGIPVLINEKSSLFSIDDFVQRHQTALHFKRKQSLKSFIARSLPEISRNIKGKQNYHKFAARLQLRPNGTPRVLVIGGSVLGQGMDALTAHFPIELIETDVSFGLRTMLICDAHDIPFDNESFDGVIAQAVLEHVVDPYRCVEEIHRVLKPEGLVYAETPFIQQVHKERYDFTRFTHLGHRRLFRKFEEIESGAVCGTGMALAWSYQYFLLSIMSSKPLRMAARFFARITSFYLKYVDYLLIDTPGTLDAASGFYFMGQKSDRVLADRDLIRLYKGVG